MSLKENYYRNIYETSISTNMELALHGLGIVTITEYQYLNLYGLPHVKTRKQHDDNDTVESDG